MRSVVLAPLLWLASLGVAAGQSEAIEQYLDVELASAQALADAAPDQRDPAAIRNLLPLRRSNAFITFVTETGAPTLGDLIDAVDALRLNKMVANAPGVGGTALVSRVAVPAVIGAAIEYGSILQQTMGTTTTLRANALGLARMLAGAQQFPYCPQLSSGGCSGTVRLLRNLSGAVAFESVRTSGEAPTGTPAPAQLLTDEFRVASLSVRLDLTPSNNLDDPKYVKAWSAAIAQLKTHPAATELTAGVGTLFSSDVYGSWTAETIGLLREVPSHAFYDVLETRLVVLATRLAAADPDFARKTATLRRAYANYFDVRDAVIREAHVHKASFEYTNLRPQNQPSMSNVRLIYSHQPTLAPVLVTLNTAATFNHEVPADSSAKQLRDVQFAAQLDRRIQNIPQFGQAVLTLAAYYQWMGEDALIKIPVGTLAPGTGIELPAEASTLLGTKGHIGVVQGKLSIPLSDVLKVPISVTWATRRELVKEKDVRGQIGLTVDLDSLFR